MGVSYQQLMVKKATSIDATTSKVIDTIALSKFHTVEYLIEFHNTTSLKVRTLKAVISRVDTTLGIQVYVRGGSGLDVEISAVRVAANMELQATNNEAESIDVKLIRITL